MADPTDSEDTVWFEPVHFLALVTGEETELSSDNSSKQCSFCKITLKNSSSLRTHQYICRNNPKKTFLKCPKCDRGFTRKKYLDLHLTKDKCHLRALKNCSYPDCEFTYVFKTALIDHLRNFHESNVRPEETIMFNNWADFCTWKDSEEERTFSCYSQQCGEKNKTVHFYCQQDGSVKNNLKLDIPALRSTRSRQNECKKILKSKNNHKASQKVPKVCISMIKAKKQIDGSVEVRYYPTHSHPLHSNHTKDQ